MSRTAWYIGLLLAVLVIVPAIWLIRPALIDNVVSEPVPTQIVPTTPSESPQPNTAAPSSIVTPDVPPLVVKSPLTPPPAPSVPDSAPTPPIPKEAHGTFEGRAGHEGMGTARLITVDDKRFIRFEDDFFVTNGPDVRVYLGRNGTYAPETFLGDLKGNKGSQNYLIPEGIDPATFNEVWIWCRAFSVPMASAVLAPQP